MRINVYLADGILEQIDAYCEANGLTRSALIKIATLNEIDKGVYTHTNVLDEKKPKAEVMSDTKKEGYHYVPFLGKWLKD